MISDEKLKEYLTAGEIADPKSDPNTWKPSGKCHGVFYLDELVVRSTKRNGEGVDIPIIDLVAPSSEREALAYLRPVSDFWKRLNPGLEGLAMPDAAFLIPEELRAESKKRKQKVRWHFCAEFEECINANQQNHAGKWKLFKVKDDIYACIYDGENS